MVIEVAKYIVMVLALAYLVLNVWVLYRYSVKEMRARFIDGICVEGKVLLAIFYFPAWGLKAFKSMVMFAVR